MFNTNLTQNSEWIRDTSSLARRSPDAAGRVQFRVLPCLLSPFFQLDNGFLSPPAARQNTGPTHAGLSCVGPSSSFVPCAPSLILGFNTCGILPASFVALSSSIRDRCCDRKLRETCICPKDQTPELTSDSLRSYG